MRIRFDLPPLFAVPTGFICSLQSRLITKRCLNIGKGQRCETDEQYDPAQHGRILPMAEMCADSDPIRIDEKAARIVSGFGRLPHGARGLVFVVSVSV